MEDKVGFREGKSHLRQVMLRTTKPLLVILLLLPLSLDTEAADFDLAEYCEWHGKIPQNAIIFSKQ